MAIFQKTEAIIPSQENKKKRISFIGQPNTGKSTFFNRITNAGASVANWPGLTVELLQAEVNLNGQLVEFVDLPGIYDLDGFTDPPDEIVDMSEMPRLTSYLLALGYTDKQIQSILGGNALRVLRESWGKQ